MPFIDIKREVLGALPTETGLSIDDIINRVYEQLWKGWQWSFAKGEALLPLVAPYSTGTVTATQGSDEIVGSGTTFTSSMVNRWIRVGSDVPFYKITTFTDTTHITIETTYIDETQSAASYSIFQHIYSLASDCHKVISPTFNQELQETQLWRLNMRDPKRLRTGTSKVFAYRGYDSSNVLQIEVWPRPEAVRGIRYNYNKKFTALSDPADAPLIREDVIVPFAVNRALMSIAARLPGQRIELMSLARVWRQEGQLLLKEAMEEDIQIYGVNRQVRDVYEESSGVGEWWAYDSFDDWD